MATSQNTTSPSRFHNLSDASLADELGRVDAIAKAAEAELPAPVKTETPQKPAPAKSPTVAEVLAKAMEPLPDVEFGGQAIDSPITGGNAPGTAPITWQIHE